MICNGSSECQVRIEEFGKLLKSLGQMGKMLDLKLQSFAIN